MRSTFLLGFGASLSWWTCLLLILIAVLVFELGLISLRSAFFTSDEDVFQALEKDPDVKRRFEEAAAGELQQGWEGRVEKGKEAEREAARRVVQGWREREIEGILRKRGVGEEERDRGEGDGGDVNKVLSRGFGDVRPDK